MDVERPLAKKLGCKGAGATHGTIQMRDHRPVIHCPKCGLEMVPFPDGSTDGAMVCEACQTCVRLGPACWDCDKIMHPVLRPSGAMWWACGCGRIVQADDMRRWIEAAVNGLIPVHMFRHEWERKKS